MYTFRSDFLSTLVRKPVYVNYTSKYLYLQVFCLFDKIPPNQCSEVSSIQNLRKRGRWFNPWLGKYSFRELMIFIVTRLISLAPPPPHCPLLFQQWLCEKAGSGMERLSCGLLVKRTSAKAWIVALATAIYRK